MAGNEVKCWDEWYPGKKQCDEIEPAQKVLSENYNFLSQRLPKLGEKVKKEIIAVICHNKKPNERAPQTEDDIFKRLNDTPLSQLSSYVDFAVKDMQNSEASLAIKRSQGLHKWTTAFQDFADTFSRFLKAYSGIVEILQSADSQYGNVAFATLSLLFATVKMKSEAESSIRSSMRQISDRLPSLDIYRSIYPDQILGSMMAHAYKNVILFSREVTAYFQGSGVARYRRHLQGTSEFQKMECEMTENFNSIRLRCDVLLAKKIDTLVKENEEFYRSWARALVTKIRDKLGLQNYLPENTIEELVNYRTLLQSVLGSDRHLELIDGQKFSETPDGMDWNGPASRLMLLWGRNSPSAGGSIYHSWLSPVAADFAHDLFHSNCPIAYLECGNMRLAETMSRIIFQLLHRDPTLIKREQDSAIVESQISRNGEGVNKIDALTRALSHIIKLHNRRVYIILDRVDQCSGSKSEYITTMLSLLRGCTTELKILIVMRGEFWDVQQNISEIDGHGLDVGIFRVVRMDQGRR